MRRDLEEIATWLMWVVIAGGIIGLAFWFFGSEGRRGLAAGMCLCAVYDRVSRTLEVRFRGVPEDPDVPARLRELARLEEDWDTEGGYRISPRSITHAWNLTKILRCSPEYRPTHDGGVEMLWDVEGYSIEVEVDSEGGMDAYFRATS
jgi:hypothetical protein